MSGTLFFAAEILCRHEGTCGRIQPFILQQKQHFEQCSHHLRLGRGLGEKHGIQSRFFSVMATKVKRNSKFAQLNSDDVTYFEELLGGKNVIQDEDTLMAANTDWMRKYRGSSKLLLQPRTTEEVTVMLKIELLCKSL